MFRLSKKNNFGFVDPISLFAVVFLLVSLTLAVPQVLKIQNINEKAAITGSCDSYGTSTSCSGACSPNGFKCKWLSASSKCSEGAISCGGSTTTTTLPTSSEIVTNTASTCTGAGMAWCAGCGGFCIKVSTTTCNQTATLKCGEVVTYTAPPCDMAHINNVVINTGVDDLVKCDGTKWVSDKTLKIENITPTYVPVYLKPDYDKAVTNALLAQQSAITTAQQQADAKALADELALTQQMVNRIPAPTCVNGNKRIYLTQTEYVDASCQGFGCTNGACNPASVAVIQTTPAPTAKPTIKPTVKPLATPAQDLTYASLSNNPVSSFTLSTPKPTIKPTIAPTLKPTVAPSNSCILLKCPLNTTKTQVEGATGICYCAQGTVAPTAKPTVKPLATPAQDLTYASLSNNPVSKYSLPTLKPTIKPTVAPTVPPNISLNQAIKASPSSNPFVSTSTQNIQAQINTYLSRTPSPTPKPTPKIVIPVQMGMVPPSPTPITALKPNGGSCTKDSDCESNSCLTERALFVPISSVGKCQPTAEELRKIALAEVPIVATAVLAPVVVPKAIAIAANPAVQTAAITGFSNLASASTTIGLTAGVLDCLTPVSQLLGMENGVICNNASQMALMSAGTPQGLNQLQQTLTTGTNTIKNLPGDIAMIYNKSVASGLISPLTENAGGINIGNTVVNKAVNPATTLNANNVNVIDDTSVGFQWVRNSVTGVMEPVAINAVTPSITQTTSNLLPSVTSTSNNAIAATQNQAILNTALSNWITRTNPATVAVGANVINSLAPSIPSITSSIKTPSTGIPLTVINNPTTTSRNNTIFGPNTLVTVGPPSAPVTTTQVKVPNQLNNLFSPVDQANMFSLPVISNTGGAVASNIQTQAVNNIFITNGPKTPSVQSNLNPTGASDFKLRVGTRPITINNTGIPTATTPYSGSPSTYNPINQNAPVFTPTQIETVAIAGNPKFPVEGTIPLNQVRPVTTTTNPDIVNQQIANIKAGGVADPILITEYQGNIVSYGSNNSLAAASGQANSQADTIEYIFTPFSQLDSGTKDLIVHSDPKLTNFDLFNSTSTVNARGVETGGTSVAVQDVVDQNMAKLPDETIEQWMARLNATNQNSANVVNPNTPPKTVPAPIATTTQNPVVAFVNNKIVQPVTNVAKNAWELVTTGTTGTALPERTVVNTNQSVTVGVKLVDPVQQNADLIIDPDKNAGFIDIFRRESIGGEYVGNAGAGYAAVNTVVDKSGNIIGFGNPQDLSPVLNQQLNSGEAYLVSIKVNVGKVTTRNNSLPNYQIVIPNNAPQPVVSALKDLELTINTDVVYPVLTTNSMQNPITPQTPPTPPTSPIQTVINKVTGFLGLGPKPPATVPAVAPSVPNTPPNMTSPTLTNPITTSTNTSDNKIIETVQNAWAKVKGTVSPVNAQLNKIVTDVEGINNIKTAEQVADLKLGQCVRDSIMCRIALGPNPDSQVVIFVNTNGTYHAALEVMNGPKSLGYLETSTGQIVQLPYYTDAGYTVYNGPVNMENVNGLEVPIPELKNAPAGLKIIKPLSVGLDNTTSGSVDIQTGGTTANVYTGINSRGEAVALKIARRPEDIPAIQSEYNFLKNTHNPTGVEYTDYVSGDVENFLANNQARELSGYKVVARLLTLKTDDISPEMLANGQIVEEMVGGQSLLDPYKDPNIKPLSGKVQAVALLNYLDLNNTIGAERGVYLDTNLDFKISVDSTTQTITATRYDATPDLTTKKADISKSTFDDIVKDPNKYASLSPRNKIIIQQFLGLPAEQRSISSYNAIVDQINIKEYTDKQADNLNILNSLDRSTTDPDLQSILDLTHTEYKKLPDTQKTPEKLYDLLFDNVEHQRWSTVTPPVSQNQQSESTNGMKFPDISSLPAGTTVVRPINIEGQTKSSDIWLIELANGEPRVLVNARTPENITDIKAQYDFIKSTYAYKPNIFSKTETLPVQDISVTKKVSDYGITGKYADYTIKTEFVKFDEATPEMLAKGQVLEAFAQGEPLFIVNKNNKIVVNGKLPEAVHEATILNYVDFAYETQLRTRKFVDLNIQQDVKIVIDDANKTIINRRIDPEPFEFGGNENTTSHFVADSVVKLLDSDYNISNPITLNITEGLKQKFNNLSPMQQNLKGLRDLLAKQKK